MAKSLSERTIFGTVNTVQSVSADSTAITFTPDGYSVPVVGQATYANAAVGQRVLVIVRGTQMFAVGLLA